MSPSLAPSGHEPKTRVDAISTLSDPLSSMSSLPSLVSLLTLAYNLPQPSPSASESSSESPQDLDRGRLATLMRTMTPEPRPPKAQTYTRDETIDAFINFLSPVLNGMAGMEDFEAAVGGFEQPDNFRDFWTYEGHNLIRDMSAGDSHGHSVKGSDTFTDVFCADPSRRIAVGRETGRLFLVPNHAQVDDEVCLAEDGLLRVVRSAPDGREEVGEAFVDRL